MLPAVKRNIDKATMVVAFLAGLSGPGKDVEVPDEVAKTIFRDVVADLADSSFSLYSLGAELAEMNQKAASPEYFGAPVSAPVPIVDKESSRNIAALLHACQELELSTELDQINEKIVTETKTAQLDLFHGVYLPTLKLLVECLSEKTSF
jgi:hypothetical protein